MSRAIHADAGLSFAVALGRVDLLGSVDVQLGEPVLASEGSSLGDGDAIPRRLAVDALLASQVTAEELGEVVGVVRPAAVVAKLLVLGGEPGAVAPLGVLRHRLLVPLRVSSRRDDAGGEDVHSECQNQQLEKA